MSIPELADTASDASKPARGWVWHSTDESIAAGQISVLSVVETFCALGLYGWLAFHFEHQWWLLISAVAAPIILLRSPESKALGVKWLKTYKNQSSLDWDKLDKPEKFSLLLISLLFFIFSYFLFFTQISNELENIINSWNSFELMTLSTIIFIYLTLITTTIIGIASEVLITFFSIPTIIACLTYLTLQNNTTAILGIIIGITASYYLIGIALKNTNHIIFSATNIIAGGCIALGIWLRALFIRLFATLRHFITGIKYISKNQYESLYLIDLTHPPELLPGATQVSLSFSIRGNIELIEKNKKDTWLYLILIVCWYPASIIWRWSLKSTCWLWFPLAFLLRPDKATDNVGKVRKEAVTQIWVSGLLLWVAIITALWLGTGHFSTETVQSWAELAGEDTGKWLEKLLALATPPTGLLEATLWLWCGMVGLVWLYSQYIQKQTPKALAEEDAIYEMHEEPKQMFVAHSRWLARLYTFLVFSFILLGYSFALHLANQWYPQELARFIPPWVIGWL